jgi:hypothetical protein
MSTSDQTLAFSARFLRRSFAFACVALLLLSSSTNAGPITILQFGQTNPSDIVTATDTAGTTTLSTGGNADGANVSIPVTITNFLGTSVVIPAFETFVGVTSLGTASTFHGSVFQNFSGTVEFSVAPGGTGGNYLTATFAPVGGSSAVGITGTAGGAGASLGAAQPPDNLVLTSDFAVLGPPVSMAIGFSNIPTAPGLHIAADSSIASFTAQNAGTISGSVVPEPGTLCLLSFAVVIGTLVYGKKRMKDEG